MLRFFANVRTSSGNLISDEEGSEFDGLTWRRAEDGGRPLGQLSEAGSGEAARFDSPARSGSEP